MILLTFTRDPETGILRLEQTLDSDQLDQLEDQQTVAVVLPLAA